MNEDCGERVPMNTVGGVRSNTADDAHHETKDITKPRSREMTGFQDDRFVVFVFLWRVLSVTSAVGYARSPRASPCRRMILSRLE